MRAIGRPIILQSRAIEGWPEVEHFAPDTPRMMPFLFDRSAGAGVEPSGWPVPVSGRLVGYAGGLGPDNVSELCSWLAEVQGARWWLDMETRIREEFDNADTGPGDPPLVTFVSIEKCRGHVRVRTLVQEGGLMGFFVEMHDQEMQKLREQARIVEAQAKLADARADEQKAIRVRIEAETARAVVDAERAADLNIMVFRLVLVVVPATVVVLLSLGLR